ncbi:DUF2391 family protein [Halomarina oriensis]|uniref:DUF2391 family protein n=1 Tax=Halomarina oriensis TaxID=671145 RepID=A0A6B0GJ04_9EURY|nr:DUF2391 family protein [Halomarina oriensis]MWG34866.1 DUF2391 family protein [Halomarina oriensis]
MVGPRRRFKTADVAQQLVGGFLLAGPFVVTAEVWQLANNMRWYHVLATVGIVFGIGYGALYKADAGRDPDREVEIAGVPTRFVSLMAVSFGSVLVLALAFNAPNTFAGDFLQDAPDPTTLAFFTLKATAVGAIFSVVGAATADSVF